MKRIQQSGMLGGRQLDHAAAIHITAKCLRHAKVAQGFAQAGVGGLGDQRQNSWWLRDRIDILVQRGAADELAFFPGHRVHDRDGHQRMPVGVQQFMREIAAILLGETIEPSFDRGIGGEIFCATVLEPGELIEDSRHREVGALRPCLGDQAHQRMERQQRPPAGHHVVAEIGEAAGAQALADHLKQKLLVRR